MKLVYLALLLAVTACGKKDSDSFPADPQYVCAWEATKSECKEKHLNVCSYENTHQHTCVEATTGYACETVKTVFKGQSTYSTTCPGIEDSEIEEMLVP